MVDVIGRAKVVITGDVDSRSIDQAGGKIGKSLKTGAVIGVAALGTLAVGAVKSFKAFEEAEAVSRKFNKVLDNMGQSDAGPRLEKLADSLQRLTGIDDEVIKGGQTILATFKGVAATAGDVGGTFDRATQAAVDMSTVFGSVESASRVLGRALSDPENAAARLKRAQVDLSAEQKTLIENFVKAGDAAGAQDVILDALEDRYKGTAEAAGIESEKIARAFDEMKENIGLALSNLTDGELSSLSDAMFAVSDSIKDLAESEGWENLGDALGTLNKDAKDTTTFIGQMNQRNKDAAGDLGDLAAASERAAKRIKNAWGNMKDLWADWGESIGDTINRLIDKLNDLEDASYSAAQSDGLDLLTDPGKNSITEQAVGGPASGLTLINENGPELVSLPNGSYVHNAPATKAILDEIRSASGGGSTQNYYITGPVSLAELRQRAAWYDTYGTRFG